MSHNGVIYHANIHHHVETLPDHIRRGLISVFVGTNPGLRSAQIGHYFAGKSNMFWRLLHEAGFTAKRLTPESDSVLLDYGYGLTDVVKRPTRSTTDLTNEDGSGAKARLDAIIESSRPKTVTFVGKMGFRIYTGSQAQLNYGAQNLKIKESDVFLMPSTSGASFADTKYGEKLYWYRTLRNCIEGRCAA